MNALHVAIRNFGITLTLVFLAVRVSGQTTDSNQPFATLLDRYAEEYLLLNPIQATFMGDHRYDDRLPNPLNPEYRKQKKNFYEKYQTAVQTFEKASLTSEEKLSQDLLLWECSIHLDQLEFPTQFLPINQFESFHLTVGQLAAGSGAHPFKTVPDYKNWLKRLEQFCSWPADAIEAMKQGIEHGHVLPRSLVKKVVPQITDLSKRPVEQHLFYTPILNLPSTFSETEKRELAHQYRTILDKKIIPAFEDLRKFLVTRYLANSRNTSGIFALPNGRDYYQHQIKIYTTTTLTPDQIFRLGKDEVH